MLFVYWSTQFVCSIPSVWLFLIYSYVVIFQLSQFIPFIYVLGYCLQKQYFLFIFPPLWNESAKKAIEKEGRKPKRGAGASLGF